MKRRIEKFNEKKLGHMVGHLGPPVSPRVKKLNHIMRLQGRISDHPPTTCVVSVVSNTK